MVNTVYLIKLYNIWLILLLTNNLTNIFSENSNILYLQCKMLRDAQKELFVLYSMLTRKKLK